MAAYQVVCALLRADRTEDGEHLAVDMAEVVQREARPDAPSIISVAGALWLISAVIAGRQPGRTGPEEVTFFKSVGIAVQDLAARAEVILRARELGLGQPIDL